MSTPRSLYEATLDIDYAICLAEAHTRLLGRIRKAIAFVGVVGGSAAVYSLFSSDPRAAGAYGIVMALLSAFDLVYDPGGMAYGHQRDRQAFLDLRRRVAKLSLASIDAELAKCRIDAATCLKSLERPVYCRNLRSHGHDVAHIKLGAVEKIAGWLA